MEQFWGNGCCFKKQDEHFHPPIFVGFHVDFYDRNDTKEFLLVRFSWMLWMRDQNLPEVYNFQTGRLMAIYFHSDVAKEILSINGNNLHQP